MTHMAMNSSIELFSTVLGRRGISELSSVGSASASSSSGASDENEFEATNRVYSHPTLRQNLQTHTVRPRSPDTKLCTDSPNALLSSRRASAGHQNLDTNAAHRTPT